MLTSGPSFATRLRPSRTGVDEQYVVLFVRGDGEREIVANVEPSGCQPSRAKRRLTRWAVASISARQSRYSGIRSPRRVEQRDHPDAAVQVGPPLEQALEGEKAANGVLGGIGAVDPEDERLRPAGASSRSCSRTLGFAASASNSATSTEIGAAIVRRARGRIRRRAPPRWRPRRRGASARCGSRRDRWRAGRREPALDRGRQTAHSAARARECGRSGTGALPGACSRTSRGAR